MSTPHVVVVVLNWNRVDDTLECLESLARLDYPSYDVVVVDNGSTDGSAEAIRTHFPGVTVIENTKNLGFTGGNNIGLRHVLKGNAAFALLLNNDTTVDPLFLGQLVEVAQSDTAVGVVGPTIYYYSEPKVIWSAGGAIDWQQGRTRLLGLDEQDSGQLGSAPREVDYVSGCAMLVHRRTLEQAGLLDERFFAYYEEVEWCVRMRQAGFRILHVPQAHIWHKISPAAQGESPRVHYYMTRNRLLLLKCSRTGVWAWVHTLVFEYLRTLISWSVRPKWRAKKAVRQMMTRAIWDAFVGRWGQLAESTN